MARATAGSDAMISRIARSSAGGTRPRITSARPSRTETQKISPERIAKNTTSTTTPTTIHGVINAIIPGRTVPGEARSRAVSVQFAARIRCTLPPLAASPSNMRSKALAAVLRLGAAACVARAV